MPWALAIHGGAGLIQRNSLSSERERACREALARILDEGSAQLRSGSQAVDVAVAAVRQLEEEPLFNAGRGAVLASSGLAELDAAVMDGRTRAAGAVAAVRTTRSPIGLARAVMEQTPHVLLAEAGADAFAREIGLEQVERSWFVTEERVRQLADMQRRGAVGLDHGGSELDRYGTVGAVVCDAEGQLAAATSTGGMVNKRPGRVGDTPIVGAGTFADSRTCAVSGTGHGEPFIRLSVAARISAWMDIGGLDLQAAAERVIHRELAEVEGLGGAIAVDGQGRVAMPFSTAGMFRGCVTATAAREVAIW